MIVVICGGIAAVIFGPFMMFFDTISDTILYCTIVESQGAECDDAGESWNYLCCAASRSKTPGLRPTNCSFCGRERELFYDDDTNEWYCKRCWKSYYRVNPPDKS